MADIKIKTFINKIRNKNKRLITFLLNFIVFGFLLTFIPLDDFGIHVDNENYLSLIIKFSSSTIFSFLVGTILFSTDPMATGKSRISQYFRSFYPSIIVKNQYSLTDGQASELWFSFLNIWSQPTSKYHLEWSTLFERSYRCRLIHYLKKLLLWVIIISVGVCCLQAMYEYIYLNVFKIEFKEIVYILFVGILYLYLELYNKYGDKPSGCWYKYKESSEMQYAILQKELFAKAITYNEAIKVVEQLIHQNKPEELVK